MSDGPRSVEMPKMSMERKRALMQILAIGLGMLLLMTVIFPMIWPAPPKDRGIPCVAAPASK